MAFDPVQRCEQCEVKAIRLTFAKGLDLKKTFVPIVELDKKLEAKGFKYGGNDQYYPLSSYIENRSYPLERIVIGEPGEERAKEITLQFTVKQGNKAATDNSGKVNIVTTGVDIGADAVKTVKYGGTISLTVPLERIGKEARIDFYANDDDDDEYLVAHAHCGGIVFVEKVVDNTIDYHIYADDYRIERHEPADYTETETSALLSYRYYYHVGDQVFHIATLDAVRADKYSTGKKTKPESGTYATRDGSNGPRYYPKLDGKIILVHLPERGIDISAGTKRIKYGGTPSRDYMDPQAYASMLGAIGEASFEDITFNGCTCREGIGYPSVSHVKGFNTDFRYLRTDETGAPLNIKTETSFALLDVERQNTFITALRNFGWSDPRGHKPPGSTSTLDVKHLDGHADHLHCQGYNKTITITKK